MQVSNRKRSLEPCKRFPLHVVVLLEGPRRAAHGCSVRCEAGPRRTLSWRGLHTQTPNDNGWASLAGLDKLGLLRQALPLRLTTPQRCLIA